MRFTLILLCCLPHFSSAQLDGSFSLELENFNNEFISKTCDTKKTNSRCPQFIQNLNSDDFEDRAFIVKSRAPVCRRYIGSAKIKDPHTLLQSLEQSNHVPLGQYSNQKIQNCVAEPDAIGLVSKFYYYNTRLNLGAEKIIQDRIQIARYLGRPSPPCPSPSHLAHAAEICESLKRCPANEAHSNLSELSKRAQADEELFLETQEQLKKLPSNCKQNPECFKSQAALSGIILGLQEQNPWLLSPDYLKDRAKKTTSERLQEFLLQYDKDLRTSEKNIDKVSNCVHGRGQCDLSEMRDILSLMPEVPIQQSRDGVRNSLNSYYEMQSCLEEGSVDRNKTGKILNETYLNVGLTAVTFGVGALVNSARLGLTTTRAGRIAVESANLSADSINLFMASQEVAKECFQKNPELAFNKNNAAMACLNTSGALGKSSRDHGSCLVSAGLGIVSGLVMIPGGLRARELYQEVRSSSHPQRRTTDQTVYVVEKRHDDLKKVIREPEGKNLGTVKFDAVPNQAKNLQITARENVEGKKILYFETAEKLPNGKWVKTPKEIQMDQLSGAIDANFPAGREYFEKSIQAKSGKSYFAFIDVGSLGAVNKTFDKGSESGDRYLKSVAEKIIKNGEGKVTLARLGGDEFGLIIDETDPARVKKILENIQADIRKDLVGDAKQVFREEKISRAQAYRENPTIENRQKIDELSRIQQPDISIGATQIGSGDALSSLLTRAESQAKDMKIKTTLEFGRSAEKYGSKEVPKLRPNPMYMAKIDAPIPSSTWTQKAAQEVSPPLEKLNYIQNERLGTVTRFNDLSLAKYKDELGRETYRVEKYLSQPNSSGKTLVSYEIPTRGETGLLDATHPESQNLIREHFLSQPNNALVMPKLTSLRYLNYFESGTEAGDRILAAVAKEMKSEMRSTDLTFKGAGADFIWSIGEKSDHQISQALGRINQELKNSDLVKEVISKERNLIMEKRAEAIRSRDHESVRSLGQKLKELDNFTPKIEYQVIRRHEMKADDSYKKTIQMLDEKFHSKSKGTSETP